MNFWQFLDKHGPGFVKDLMRCVVVFGILAWNAGSLADLTEARDTGLIFMALRAIGMSTGEKHS